MTAIVRTEVKKSHLRICGLLVIVCFSVYIQFKFKQIELTKKLLLIGLGAIFTIYFIIDTQLILGNHKNKY